MEIFFYQNPFPVIFGENRKQKKVPMATKPRGAGGKAPVVGPTKKELFFAASQSNLQVCEGCWFDLPPSIIVNNIFTKWLPYSLFR